jgi:hypothetical protein
LGDQARWVDERDDQRTGIAEFQPVRAHLQQHGGAADITVQRRGYSVAEEITSICADFLVERRGFELMAIAACSRLSAVL